MQTAAWLSGMPIEIQFPHQVVKQQAKDECHDEKCIEV